MRFVLMSCLFLLTFSMMAGCSSTYYNTMEKFGVHKRDIMVDRVGEARDAQAEAKEQFQSAYEQFASVVTIDGGQLEEKYALLSDAYERSKDTADLVHERIESVEAVSEALFEEWEAELELYTSEALRGDSERKMKKTYEQYQQLIGAMKKAESKIYPVLVVFKDQVLYLKHNLNARAINSLQGELISLEQDVARLVKDMEVSIREADLFINQLQSG